ncbi:hypothetical protein TNCV_697291 [Trichonephila clavipes]|nr:hypothetical protein TNCV_697291 [Trichonephila clavipes]
MRYLDCVSSLQPSIWFCDLLGVAALVGRGRSDFRSGDPMGVKVPSVMESQQKVFLSLAGEIWDILYNIPSDRSPGS